MTTLHPIFYAVNRTDTASRRVLKDRLKQAVDNWYDTHNNPSLFDRIPHNYDYIISWWQSKPLVALFPAYLRVQECTYEQLKEIALRDGADIISIDEYIGSL